MKGRIVVGMDLRGKPHFPDIPLRLRSRPVGPVARSLVRRPSLMLMDEPSSDLDPATRAAVRQEVLRILQRTVFVGLSLDVLLLMLAPLLRPLLI